ncbi:MAG: APC family permease [Deltaproteobacteria bacterium]|nr:APC family permease [Deltaproteobacteria bacterium]
MPQDLSAKPPPEDSPGNRAPAEPPGPLDRLKTILFGPARDIRDKSIFHRLALVPVLAWVGLGADGLSSSSYGPEEAFRTLGRHTYLALGIAALMTVTILLISAAYSRIIEEFPHGGGGYVVASKLLGARAGVVSGSALVVDYVLTISVSVAASTDAMFSFLPPQWLPYKLWAAAAAIIVLSVLNIRGVRESILVLAPIFVLFLATHVVLIAGGLAMNVPATAEAAGRAAADFRGGLATLGAGGMLLLFLHAYSMGGGTYTGIEAVANGLSILREPKVQTGKRTMAYMAVSLAATASGLMVLYLLLGVTPVEGKTMNAVLAESFAGPSTLGRSFVVAILLAEAALLVVAAQAGFMGGPAVLANMAMDYWVPRRFSSLSDRLTTRNGIVLMGAASLASLIYTGGSVRHLVVMYSINVFLTFSMSMFGMARMLGSHRGQRANWRRRFTLFAFGFLMCATILGVTVVEKFPEGGWLTLAVTGGLVMLCLVIRRHYRMVASKLSELDVLLTTAPRHPDTAPTETDPDAPTAAVLVAGYGGLGVHTVLNIVRMFPGHYRNVVFLSVGEIGSGAFKGERSIDELAARAEASLAKYRSLAKGMGLGTQSRLALGTDVVEEAEKLCLAVSREFPKVTFFAGKVIFERERWWHRILHNDMGFVLQKRLQWDGHTMVIVPAKVA